MNLLQVSFGGTSITPMRSEYPTKSFSSADVPLGTDSVYVKAAQILQHTHGKVLTEGIPQFTQAEIDTKVSTKEAALSAVDTLASPNAAILDQTEVLNPTATEKQAKVDTARGFTEEKATDAMEKWNEANSENTRTLDQQKAEMRRKDAEGVEIDDLTTGEASTALVDASKQAMAELQASLIIDQCLEVPTVSAAFKAQFTVVEEAE